MEKVIQGDCLEEMDKLISEGVVVDSVICDPPYNTTNCEWDKLIPFDLMWERLNRLIKPNGAIVLFGSEPFSSALRMSNIKNYKYDWIWEKTRPTGFFLAKKQPMKIHEFIHLFYSQQCLYKPIKTKAPDEKIDKRKTLNPTVSPYLGGIKKERVRDVGLRYPLTIQKFPSISEKGQHPTQKPVALMEYLIKTYTNEGETVLDFTAGSGTTGVACKNLNRNFILIEKEEKYINIIKQRLK